MNPPELFPQPPFPSEPLDVFHVPLGGTTVPLKVSELSYFEVHRADIWVRCVGGINCESYVAYATGTIGR
jgi:hypothetical protein